MSDAAPAVELVTIGDELLLGETVDGNSAWIGRRLANAGIRVVRRSTVGDDVASIRSAVADALERTGTVLVTGGLGPTQDDLTRPAIADLFGRELVVDEAVLEGIRRRFAARGLVMAERNRVQAEVPAGARVLPNSRGTAPGLALKDAQGRLVVLLPGVPAEMHALVDEQVLPLLLARWPGRNYPVRSRVLRTTGIPESAIAEAVADLLPRLAPLSLAFLPLYAGVDLRLTTWGALPEEEADRVLEGGEVLLRERLGRHVYGTGDDDLAAVVGRELVHRGFTLALAESCTGGLIAKRLTDPAGASAYLNGAVVAYANGIKERLLGVRRATLEAHGAVSEAVAREMAEGARRMMESDVALSVTGIAGPTGGTPDKPVGTVWIGISVGERTEARHFRFLGDREEVRERAAQAALALLWTALRDGKGP